MDFLQIVGVAFVFFVAAVVCIDLVRTDRDNGERDD